MKYDNKLVYNVREISSIRELFDGSCELYPNNIAFLYRDGDSVREITYTEAGNDVRALATYFNSIGLEGRKIAVTGKNSYFWAITYLAVCAGTGIILPVDKDLRSDETAFILSDSEASAIVYSPETAAKINECEFSGIKINMADLPELIEKGKSLIESGDTSYARHKVDPFALGILLYTSGTTGIAKGVMLSQNNICSNIVHVMRRVSLDETERTLSILPLHHTYECMAGFLAFFYSGASIAYNDSINRLKANLVLFKPTVLVTVPLVLEMLYHNIVSTYSRIKGGKAVLAAQKAAARLAGDAARRKIFHSVSEAMGGRLRRILVGAAALRPDVFEDFQLFGFRVMVGYGLTETSPVCIMHDDFYQCPYDTGFPLVGVQCRICDPNEDGIGELAVKGSNVMLGYYKNPEETEKVMRDGWFYTGDLAKQTENGAYCITGRIKSMIVLQNGKKVFPEEQETFISRSPLVKECMVHLTERNGKKVLAVTIYPNSEAIQAESEKRGMTASELLSEVVSGVNKGFPSYKHIFEIIIRDNEFVKTTTGKIKRNAAENAEERKDEDEERLG